MENSRATVEKTIKIKMMVNQTTNLILALCDEYKGLTVFGKNFAEIEKRLPGVISDYFSMLGYEVESVGVLDSEKEVHKSEVYFYRFFEREPMTGFA